ncbi:MAG TPA: hypothetical protein VFV79_02860 [Saprospiraceae bacterium]|nr:hypothetical protein [Saprospiraceae bacterium]
MKYLILILVVASIIACHKDDDDSTPSGYPITYTFHHIDQTDEGLYLVTSPTTLSDLPTTIGLYGQYKDSLKTELKKYIESQIDLDSIELTSDTTLVFHYVYLGHPVGTPVKYTVNNGQITIAQSLFSGVIGYDKSNDAFNICGAIPIALPGPNAQNPFGSPYFQIQAKPCIEGHANKDYALDFLIAKHLQNMDTVGVLITRYIYSKQ